MVVFSIINKIGEFFYFIISEVGDFTIFQFEIIKETFMPPFRWKELLFQLEFIGVKSWGIVSLTGLFAGMVIALESSYALGLFNAQYLIGPSTALSLFRELGPVFTALMVTGRAGSAMATELGSMKVTEQIDALFVMAVDPVQFLVVPRVIATIVMMPLLVALFNFLGMIGAFLISVYSGAVTPHVFIDEVVTKVHNHDLYGGLIKAFFFGMVIAGISTYMGMRTKGGARGVGETSTLAVVFSSITIMIADYILTPFIF